MASEMGVPLVHIDDDGSQLHFTCAANDSIALHSIRQILINFVVIEQHSNTF
jgi:hypothetical protein